ncbi:MAG: hypothetical protein AAF721_21690 [Myxococcota bacterium]
MPNEASELGRMKGSTVGAFFAWYEREIAAGKVREAVLSLAPEDAARFDLDKHAMGVLASHWYDAAPLHQMLDYVFGETPEPVLEDVTQRAGTAVAEEMRTGVYKILFNWFMTPGRYAKVVSRIWRLNYDSGRVETEVLAPNRHRGTVHDWAGHHGVLCRINVAIKAEIYRAMGCRGVEIESRYCVDNGDDACGSIIRWDEAT